MLISIFGHLLAVVIGISLGLIGGGGSILAAPVLIYIMDVPSKSALAMTLVIVGVASLIGVLPHWRNGNVNLRTAALFAPPAMVGAYLGARVASLEAVLPILQLGVFAAMMVFASVLMIRKGSRHSSKAELMPEEMHGGQWWAIAAEGLGVGMLTGFVGIGGGFLVIPALVLLGGMPMKEAVGTSLIILALKSVTGFAGYVGNVPIQWDLLMSFTIAAGIGIVLGAYINRFVAAKQLEKGFGYFVLAVAVFIIIREFTPMLAGA